MRAIRTALAAALLVALAAGAAAQPPDLIARAYERQSGQRLRAPLSSSPLFDDKGMRLVICGSGSPIPDPGRAKSCAAVIVKGRVFIVDAGPGSAEQLALMGFPMDRVNTVFLTHYHSDHIGDLGELRFQSWAAGRRTNLVVHGPPGVERVTAGFNMAYALDDGYRTLHHGEAAMPSAAAPLAAAPFTLGPDGKAVVFKDKDLTVTAFKVKHDPIAPAVGYRFDSGGRSIVVSGDTAPTQSLVEAAAGADVLVCEALSKRMMDLLSSAALAAGSPRQAQMLKDTEGYHMSPVDGAKTANAAGVGLLVYSHLAPSMPKPVLQALFFDGVSQVRDPKAWVVAADGLSVDLPYAGGPPTVGRVAMLGSD